MLTRDVGPAVWGGWLMWHEEQTGRFNSIALLVYAGMIAGPVTYNTILLGLSSSIKPASTAPPTPPPVEQPSQPSSSS